ncbi:MAG: pyrroline-5-carboxylate reductase [Oscillospiraceae bacterium]|jgi:pyrroline-5-carboxylate reductase|nr:pyrroline-5-carboxylate reductase [Oscillospiraceae bacterium]
MERRFKFGFIGTGVMAGAMIRMAVASGFLRPEDGLLFDVNVPAAEALAEATGLAVASSAAEVAQNCTYVQLGCKPQQMNVLLETIAPYVRDASPVLVSIAAGVKLAALTAPIGEDTKAVRLMQNINASVGESMTALCANENILPQEKTFLSEYCRSFGKVIELDENAFSAFVALAGSGPAFVYRFIDEMARAGVLCGLPKATALEIAAQTVLGSAKLVRNSPLHPAQLADNVCSPAGTTIAGVAALEENRFAFAVIAAVRAAWLRDKELGGAP